MSCHLKADSLLICWTLIAKHMQARVLCGLYSSQPIAGMAYMYFTVSKIYCSIKLPKLGLLVILNQSKFDECTLKKETETWIYDVTVREYTLQ